MACIIQKKLFSWQQVNASSDLDRLRLVLEHLGDEELMVKLERMRGRGRDDYPIRAVWNSVLAGVVFQHKSVASLRRELKRNGELRDLCGFDSLGGAKAVPSDSAYTRFLRNLMRCQGEINRMFEGLVERLGELLCDFGRTLAVDSKAIESHGRPAKTKLADGRRDVDADWGKKQYKWKLKDGTLWEKVVKWFGYKAHILVDSTYELPVAYEVTRASAGDSPQLLSLVEKTKEKHPWVVERAEELAGDKAYDSEENNRKPWDSYEIKPLIDIRDLWKDGEQTRSLFTEWADNIVYDYQGNIYCHCPETDEQRQMAFVGFEAKRGTLKYRCPAVAYGFRCAGSARCGESGGSRYGRIVRVALDTDRRIFTPIARSSYTWARKYKKRTAVERVNSQLDVSFGFEEHYIRGLAKMRLRVSLAMIVMLSMAVGRIKENQKENMRSLVKAA